MGAWLKLAGDNQYWIAAGAVALLLGLERLSPRRERGAGGLKRWAVTAFIAALSIGLAVLLQPPVLAAAGAVTDALKLPPMAQLPIPEWLLIVIALLVVDLLGYATHLMLHRAPWFWRTHKLHHSDQEFDATTGFLHHPAEGAILLAVQYLVLAVLGVPLLVIVLYSVVMQVQAPLSHANLKLPRVVDQALRLVIVTPDMHRVHHSARMDESNSNFGMLFSVWDRVFGTYRAQPAGEQATFRLGLEEDAPQTPASFTRALLTPLRPNRAVAVSTK